MNNKMKWLGIFVLAASLLLTACGAQQEPAEENEPQEVKEPES